MGDLTVLPDKGNVGMGSGLIGWAFTLRVWARMYASKFGVDEGKMMRNLWGDNYFDAEAKRWTTNSVSDSGKPLQRGFVQFVLKPLLQVFDCVTNEKKDDLVKMLSKLNITLPADALEQQGRKLMRAVMQKFLPASDALLEMIVINLPSPRKAQKYRVDTLYDGDLTDMVCFLSIYLLRCLVLFLCFFVYCCAGWLTMSTVVRRGVPQVRAGWSPHHVRLQDGADQRQLSLLRLRPCVLWHYPRWSEGPHHGLQLPGWQEGGRHRQERAAHCFDDGSLHRVR